MRVQEAVSIEVVALCRYNTAGAGLLLTVDCNTLVSYKGVMVAGVTLGSSTAPTLKAVAMKGRVRLTMACNFWIAVLWLVALMAVIGMVHCNMQRTLHTVRTMRSAVEIIGIMQWLGYSCHVSAKQQQHVVVAEALLCGGVCCSKVGDRVGYGGCI